MGIRGLSTFFNNNPDLSKRHKLHDTPVIIDGNNLIHRLYFSNRIDCIYGGDYFKYAASIKKYFSAYLQCNIKPVVIFDGGYDKSDRKFHTSLTRSKTRLTLTQHIAKYGEAAGNVLPINAKEVFRNVLSELDISFAQCDYEADDQISSLANFYKCPVISDDSDFYIFDIPNGFIRLSSVEATVFEKDVNGTELKYLECDIYYIDKFLSYFPGIDRNVLPLFGTLVGNDYVNSKDFASFFSSVQFPKLKSKGLRIKQGQKKIIGLLSWLAHCDLNEGIEQVLFHLKKHRRDHVKSVIDKSIKGYEIEKCNLALIIDKNFTELENVLKLDSKLKTLCDQSLPISFAIAFHQGKLPSFFLNIITLHRTFLPAQVEDSSLESSYSCSRYIRQVIYGILLQHSSTESKVHEKECLCSIQEYDRRNGRVERQAVEPVYSLENGSPLPMLDDLFDMQRMQLQSLVSDVLKTEMSLLPSIPDDLQLVFSCIIYWLKQCSPAPRQEFIYALILNIIYFNTLLKKSVTMKNGEYVAPEIPEQLTISSMIANISQTDAQFAIQRLKKYLPKPVLNRGNPLILHVIHSLSQLQTCILYGSFLNLLLNCPFEFPKLHETLSGTMLYNLTKDLLSRPFPDLFVSELLGRKSILSTLFNSLKNIIFENVSKDCCVKIERSQLQTIKNETKGKSNKKYIEKNMQLELSEVRYENLCLTSREDESFVSDFSEIYI